ncbi:MAG: hypothetical protein K1000chlam2_01329 [Chlamydiae bacterium]|nr:hypothetical protein [Chlamydiota bacterium]
MQLTVNKHYLLQPQLEPQSQLEPQVPGECLQLALWPCVALVLLLHETMAEQRANAMREKRIFFIKNLLSSFFLLNIGFYF